jgi:hypothetical protein
MGSGRRARPGLHLVKVLSTPLRDLAAGFSEAVGNAAMFSEYAAKQEGVCMLSEMPRRSQKFCGNVFWGQIPAGGDRGNFQWEGSKVYRLCSNVC